MKCGAEVQNEEDRALVSSLVCLFISFYMAKL